MQNGIIEASEYSRKYVESFKRNLEYVRSVYRDNPDNVKFFFNFCEIEGKTYNGIREYMMLKW